MTINEDGWTPAAPGWEVQAKDSRPYDVIGWTTDMQPVINIDGRLAKWELYFGTDGFTVSAI